MGKKPAASYKSPRLLSREVLETDKYAEILSGAVLKSAQLHTELGRGLSCLKISEGVTDATRPYRTL